MNIYREKIQFDHKTFAQIYVGKPTDNQCYFPMHWHECLEFDYILEGTIIGKIGHKQIEVNAGDFFFVNSGVLHETDAKDHNNIRSITILLSYYLVRLFFPDIKNYYFDFSDNPEAKEEIKELIIKCAHFYELHDNFYQLDINIIIHQICNVLLKKCLHPNTNTPQSKEQQGIDNIKKAIAYIDTHYEAELSLPNIAQEAGMTPTYFCRFFKQGTGESFYDYLTRTRLVYAFDDIVHSELSVTDIAMKNGFPNVKSFITSFQKIYSLTPWAYRTKYVKPNKKDNI